MQIVNGFGSRAAEHLTSSLLTGLAAVAFLSVGADAAGGVTFGTQVGSYVGVPAYSNGSVGYVSGQNTYIDGHYIGLKWQCVEYVRRYYYLTKGMDLYASHAGNANTFWAAAGTMGLAAYPNGGSTSPQEGDLLTSNGGTYGHVAIVRSVSGSQVCVIQQNWANTSADASYCMTLSSSGGAYTLSGFSGSYPVQGWLRKPGGTGCSTGYSVGQNADNPTAFVDAYNRNNGQSGLGCAIGDVHRWGSGYIQDFRGGSGGDAAIMLADGGTTAWVIHGDIWLKYKALTQSQGGSDPDIPGYPITDERNDAAPSSVTGATIVYNNLQNGSIEYHSSGPRAGTAVWLGPDILGKWRNLGFASSALGAPIADEFEATPSRFGVRGRVVPFENGEITWHRNGSFATYAFETHGGLDVFYVSTGGTGGCLGFPSADQGTANSATFEGGTIWWNGSSYQSSCGGTKSDFNADGKPDLLWQNQSTGAITVWTMNGTTPQTGIRVGVVSDTSWKIVGTADFNADGKPDLLWQNQSTGAITIWTMNGTTPQAGIHVGAVSDTSWKIVGATDLNADGKPDLLWQNQVTGAITIWTMNGTTAQAGIRVGAVSDTSWKIVGTADFNGDRKPDLLWHNQVTGAITVWTMNGTTPQDSVGVGAVTDTSWKIVGTADFNADGNSDLLWLNQSTGAITIWTMNRAAPQASIAVGALSNSWKIVSPR